MTEQKIRIKVWDLSTRVFHWGMIALLAALWWTAEEGHMEWHQICAYTLASMLIFRLIWGFIGSETSRFSHFVSSPKKAIQYIKDAKSSKVNHNHIGHNPIGGYMVVMLLALLAAQFITGLYSTDDIFTEGPLYSTVSGDIADSLTWLHKNIFYLILGLAVVHVIAVITHSLKGDKIVPAMFTGKKEVGEQPEKPLMFQSSIISLILWVITLGSMAYFLIIPIWQSI